MTGSKYNPDELEAAYREMANDLERESEALEWAEATIDYSTDETPLTCTENDEHKQ